MGVFSGEGDKGGRRYGVGGDAIKNPMMRLFVICVSMIGLDFWFFVSHVVFFAKK